MGGQDVQGLQEGHERGAEAGGQPWEIRAHGMPGELQIETCQLLLQVVLEMKTIISSRFLHNIKQDLSNRFRFFSHLGNYNAKLRPLPSINSISPATIRSRKLQALRSFLIFLEIIDTYWVNFPGRKP